MSKLTVIKHAPEAEATRIEPEDDRPTIGSWWWVKATKNVKTEDLDLPHSRQWLGCVVEVGSNYVKLEGVSFHCRMAIDDMPRLCTVEPAPHAFIDTQIARHRDTVRSLMGEIKRVCQQLGVPMHQALAEAEAPTTALAVAHGATDVKRYGKALVKAKDKTLPELFEKVKEQHKEMATWMNAELIPAKAELAQAKGITQVIENKIHTVELYAGLQEELVCVREGDAADASTKVHLMQRRCYMDEECLAEYEAGGMDFQSVKAFDKWIARDENMTRILPHERCIVAMRIRRHDKDYEIGNSLSRFIKFRFHNKWNKQTFLYIRNGRQLWRMATSIDFGPELFPSREDAELVGDDELWVKPNGFDSERFITGRQRNNMIDMWRSERAYCAQVLWQWHRAGCPGRHRIDAEEYTDEDAERVQETRKWTYVATDHPDERYNWKAGETHEADGDPRRFPFGLIDDSLRRCHDPDWRSYQRVTPENIYYDDAMKRVQAAAFEHNRVAVVVQGLLDRSTCLHPHPPWRIWTPEGFAAGIELVYDDSRALTPGDAPDWEGYRAQLNKSIRAGCFTIGQRRAWKEEMEDRYGEKWRYQSHGGNGPEHIDQVHQIKRTGKALFKFTRERMRPKWIPNPERPGWLKPVYPAIPMTWWCPVSELTCIDAYTPGDFHMFFDDPRTRAQYIQWAPILLAAEDWHAARRNPKPSKEEPEPEETEPEEDEEGPKTTSFLDGDDDDDEEDEDDDDDEDNVTDGDDEDDDWYEDAEEDEDDDDD